MSESFRNVPAWMTNRDRLFYVMAAALMLLAAAYLGKGFVYTIANEGEADLHRRWIEQQYILRGQNPYDVAFRERAMTKGDPLPETSRDAMPAPDLGIPYDVDYPPWTYLSGMLFFWPSARLVAVWYSLWNALGLVVIGVWADRMAGDCSRAARLFLVASVMAIGAFCMTIGTGNYGIIVLALLVLGYQMSESGRPIGAGLALGVSLLKPTLSGPFLVAHLVKRQVGVLAVVAGYLIAASVVVWGFTRTDPLEMTGQMLHASRHFVGAGFGPLNVAIASGVPYSAAVLGTAAVVVGLGFAVMIIFRDRPLLTHYAIAAVTTRLWTYHLVHSNLIMLFLLVALWRQAVARPRPAAIIAYAAVAMTLWLPAKVSELRPVSIVQYVVWIAGLIVLLKYEADDARRIAREARIADRIVGYG
jgi:hypothetical protein